MLTAQCSSTNSHSMACLLIHGFAGEPFEMEGLADTLRQAGFAVHIPCLPGHGSTEQDFSQSFFADWAKAVEMAFDTLAARYDKVMVVGFSMGGALALHLGAVRKPAAIATLAAPLFLYSFHPFIMTDWRLPFVPFLKYIQPRWTVPSRPNDAANIAPWRGYEGFVLLPQVDSLMKGMRAVGRNLQHINAPLLLFQARKDGTVPYINAYAIASKVSSGDVRLRLFDMKEDRAGHHMIATHQECRHMIAAELRDFALEIAQR